MAKTITTTSIESKNRVFGSYDVWDFLFIMLYVMLSYGLRLYVHPRLRIPFFIFSVIVAVFLTSRSSMNKRRKIMKAYIFSYPQTFRHIDHFTEKMRRNRIEQ